MKIVCTTESVIEKKKSCKREYCCKRLEFAMNPIMRKSNANRTHLVTDKYSLFFLTNSKVSIPTHEGNHDNERRETIDFCPFCGEELTVEHVKVDHTGLRPKAPKKHWWTLAGWVEGLK